jgi:hypothetical protein
VHRYILFSFASALGDDLRVAGSAVVARHFCDQVIGPLGAFIHHADKRVAAIRAFVSHRSSRFDFCRRRAFGQSDERLRSFLGVGNGSEGKCERAEARNEERFAIDCFHIVSFYFICFDFAFWAALIELRIREKHSGKKYRRTRVFLSAAEYYDRRTI